ncbi:MAG: hypothetical protein RLZZ236_1956 [Bacteroidota bacterium]|jgi:hypothetical protein
MVYEKTLFIVKFFSSVEVVSFRGSYFSGFTDRIEPHLSKKTEVIEGGYGGRRGIREGIRLC